MKKIIMLMLLLGISTNAHAFRGENEIRNSFYSNCMESEHATRGLCECYIKDFMQNLENEKDFVIFMDNIDKLKTEEKEAVGRYLVSTLLEQDFRSRVGCVEKVLKQIR